MTTQDETRQNTTQAASPELVELWSPQHKIVLERQLWLAVLRALVDAQVEAGISGLVPCGTTGESPTLSHH